MPRTAPFPLTARRTTVAGSLLLLVTVATVVAMAHHPTAAGAPDLAHAVADIARFSRLSATVHGALIAALLATLYCLSEFAYVRGTDRPLVRAGTIAYAAGTMAMIGAALFSGFVVADVASSMPHDTSTDQQILRQLLVFCGIVNQASAHCAVVAMSAGIVLWSLDLWRGSGADRAVGAFGCVVGLAPMVALAIGAIHLDVHGMTIVALLDAAWQLAIAALLIRAGR